MKTARLDALVDRAIADIERMIPSRVDDAAMCAACGAVYETYRIAAVIDNGGIDWPVQLLKCLTLEIDLARRRGAVLLLWRLPDKVQLRAEGHRFVLRARLALLNAAGDQVSLHPSSGVTHESDPTPIAPMRKPKRRWHHYLFPFVRIYRYLEIIMENMQQLATDLNALKDTLNNVGSGLTGVQTEVGELQSQIKDLSALIGNGQTTPEVDQALADVKAAADSVQTAVANLATLATPPAPQVAA